MFSDNQIKKRGKFAIDKIQVNADCTGFSQHCDSCQLLVLAKVSKNPILTTMKQVEIIKKFVSTNAFFLPRNKMAYENPSLLNGVL